MMNERSSSSPATGRPADGGVGEAPEYRPIQRFWPYVDLPEEPTDEEVAAVDPDLRAELFGPDSVRFSITVAFPKFEGENYSKAVDLAKRSSEYLEVGHGEQFRHRARFFASDVSALRDLWVVVGGLHETDVLVDGRPVPYARTLWLPLCWFLLFR
jgi:hypothetical protein